MAEVTFAAVEGTIYYIALDAWQDENGNIDYGNVSLSLVDLGAPVELPPGAVGLMDFSANGYKYHVYDLLADEVIDRPEYVVPGAGLWICDFSELRTNDTPNLLSSFLDFALTANWTIVVDFYVTENEFVGPFNMSANAISSGHPFLGTEFESGPSGSGYYFLYDTRTTLGGGERDAFVTDFSATILPELRGAFRFGLTRTNSRLALCLDGGAVFVNETDQSPPVPAWVHAMLGGDSDGPYSSFLMGRIEFYPEQTDAALQTLTGGTNSMANLKPGNDDFVDAYTLELDVPSQSWNFGAGYEVGEPDHSASGNGFRRAPDGSSISGVNGGSSVWWKFTATATRNYHLTTDGSSDLNDWGMYMVVYSGSAVGSLTEVAADRVSFPQMSVTFAATVGVTYHIVLTGYRDGMGTLALTISEA